MTMNDKFKKLSDTTVNLSEFTETKDYLDGIITELGLDKDLPTNIQYEIKLSEQVGAYAFPGNNPKIVLTKGLLEFATRGELMAVLGHEANHILGHNFGLRVEENECDFESVKRLIANNVSPETIINFFRRYSSEGNYDPKAFHINEMLHDEHSPFEQRIRNVQMYMANKNKYGEQKGLELYADNISSEIKIELDETAARYLAQLPEDKPSPTEHTVKDDPITRLHGQLASLTERGASESEFDELCQQLRTLKIDAYDNDSLDKLNALVDYANHNLPKKTFINIYRAAGFSVVPPQEEKRTMSSKVGGSFFYDQSRKKQSDIQLPAFSVFRQLLRSTLNFANAKSLSEKVLNAIEINTHIAKINQLIPLFQQAGSIVEITADQCDYFYGLQRSMNTPEMIQELHQDTSGQIVLALWHLGFFKPPKEYDYSDSLNELGYHDEVVKYALEEEHRVELEMLIWDKMYEHHPDLIKRVITDPGSELFGVMLSDRIILGAERNKNRPIRKKFSPKLSQRLRQDQVEGIITNKNEYKETLLNTDFSNTKQRNAFLQRYGDIFQIDQVGDHFENIESQAIQLTLDIFSEMLATGNPQYSNPVIAFFQHLHSVVNYHAGAALPHTSSYAQFIVRHQQHFPKAAQKEESASWHTRAVYPANEAGLFNILFGNDNPPSLFFKDGQVTSILALAGVDAIESMESLTKVMDYLGQSFGGLAHHFRDLVVDEAEKGLPTYPFPAPTGSGRDYGYELIKFVYDHFSIGGGTNERNYNILAEKITWQTKDESLYDHISTEELSQIYIQFDTSSAFKSTEEKSFLDTLLLHRLSMPCNSPKEMLQKQAILHNLLIMFFFNSQQRMRYSVRDIQLRKRLIDVWAENTKEFIAFIESNKTKIEPDKSHYRLKSPNQFLQAFGYSDTEINELIGNQRWEIFHEICHLYKDSNTIIDTIFKGSSIQNQFYLLDVLSETLQLQKQNLQEIKERFDDKLREAADTTKTPTAVAHEVMNASLDSILKILSEDDELRQATIQYLIQPVSFTSARALRDKLEQRLPKDQYQMLTRVMGIGLFGVTNLNSYQNNLIATELLLLHREFHELSIENKAIAMANLLIPTKAVLTEQSQTTAFSEALTLVLDHLFPADDSKMDADERQMARSFVEAYIAESPKYTNEFILAGLLTASHDNSQTGGKMRVGQIIASICEHMGPAYVKLAQAIHSHPAIPAAIKKDLAHVKANVRMPYRWEIAAKLQNLRVKATHIGRRLGAASYNIAVEVSVDEKPVVVLLRRDDVIKQASYGFDHLQRTLARWDHPAVDDMRNTLLNIISHTAQALAQETDNEKLKQLERNAEQAYGNLTITVDDMQLHVQPMRTIAWEEEYRLLEQAPGIHFNDLPKDSPLRTGIAKAILALELNNILSGSLFDSDRHGSQLRIDGNKIGLFDFGEMMLKAPNTSDILELQNALPFMIGDAFSPITDLKLPTFQRYLKQLDENNQPLSSFVTRAYRALLALQDYMSGLSISDLFEVITSVQKAKNINKALLQTLQHTVRATADTIFQATDPTTWIAAYQLISSTLTTTPATIKMSRPEPDTVALYDGYPYDSIVWDQMPTWDPYTKQPMFSAEGFRNNESVGRYTLFGTMELCREKESTRTNILETSGVFVELASNVDDNIDQLQTCDVMPFTQYEILKHEARQGAIMGAFRGISKVTEYQFSDMISPSLAKISSKLMFYSLYFFWTYSTYMLEQKEDGYGGVTLLQASWDTGKMAAFDLGLYGSSKVCEWVSHKAEAANYLTVSKIISIIGNNLGLGLFACSATQKSLLSVGASIAGGFFAEKAIYLTAAYAGIVDKRSNDDTATDIDYLNP